MMMNFTKTCWVLAMAAVMLFSIPASAQVLGTGVGSEGPEVINVSITPLSKYIPGTTMNIMLEVTVSTPDDEYGDSLAITFPTGFTVNSADDPFPSTNSGQDPDTLNTASGTLVSWGDNDNVFGGIEPGIHIVTVNITIGAGVSGPQTLSFYMSGDEYEFASPPHFYAGTFTLNELPSVPDLSVSANYVSEYSMIPLNQLSGGFTLSAEVTNNGSNLTTTENVIAANAATGYNSTTALPNPFNTFANQTVTFPTPINFTSTGTYDVVIGVPYSGDFDLSDNADTAKIVITDSVMARDNGIAAGGLGITGTGSTGLMGNMFEISSTAYLSTVSLYLAQPTAGNTYRVEIYGFGSLPTNKIGESAVITLSSSNAGWRTIELNQTVTLSPGMYYIGVHQVSGFLSLGFSDDNYTPNTAWLNTGSAPTFVTAESVGFPVAFMVRANLGTTAPLAAPTLTLPANASTNIDNSAVVFDWTDVTGATGYEMQYSTDNTFPTTTTTTLTTTSSVVTVNNLALNTTYYWRVRANAPSIGIWSSAWSFTTVQFPVSVNEKEAKAIKIYPNPASNMVTITNLNDATVTVYSILGTVIEEHVNINGNHVLDVSGLEAGSYMISIASEENKVIRKISVIK